MDVKGKNMEKIKKFKGKLTNISCFDYALRLVSLRMMSSGALLEKLRLKGYEQEEILSAINRLTELKCLDDLQYAQIYFENLLKYRNFGYYGVKKKLLEKRLARPLVDKVMREFSLEREAEIARRILRSKSEAGKQSLSQAFSKAKTARVKTARAKIARLLQARGFRNEIIMKKAWSAKFDLP